MSLSRRTLLLAAPALLLGIALVWNLGKPQTYAFRGSLIDPPVPAPDIALSDQHGQPFRLADQRGKLVVLFFGYANCPDVCPTTLGEFAQLHRKLGPNANRVRFVFITIDPQRDTPADIAAYVDKFDAGILGLSGTEAQLQPLWDAYGVTREREDVGGVLGYTFNHSARTYVINHDGQLRLTFPFGMEVDAMLEDLLYLLEH
ncbi:MAG: SCO family protein [Anaerolineales bacterium]